MENSQIPLEKTYVENPIWDLIHSNSKRLAEALTIIDLKAFKKMQIYELLCLRIDEKDSEKR